MEVLGYIYVYTKYVLLDPRRHGLRLGLCFVKVQGFEVAEPQN